MPSNATPSTPANHRADIDGLRAIAVLCVVCFHAFPEWLTGGFTGVDVFFVISGFLISSILLESLVRGQLRWVHFYSRRINRIVPALALVLAVSGVAGWFLLLPDEFAQLGQHILGGAGFISNILLWRESGYFDNASATKPLLHLWSLGVEGQFYVTWPLIVWCAWKLRFNCLVITLVLFVLSFAWNIVGAHTNPNATFFLLPTRFWQLSAGSAVAFIVHQSGFLARVLEPKYDGRAIGNVLSVAGLVLIAIGAFILTGKTPYPGIWALFPTLGTALIILAGPRGWLNRALLSNPWLVWVGLISYPLYLWHWPLLSFAHILQNGEPTIIVRFAAILVAILLAWGTYRWIETPVRARGRVPQKASLFLLPLIIGVGLAGYQASLVKLQHSDAFERFFANDRSKFYMRMLTHAYRDECNFHDVVKDNNGEPSDQPRKTIDPSCYTKRPAQPKSVFLWGEFSTRKC